MPFLTLFILAIIQGLTEFLPVSSSGHLVLVHAFAGGGEAARWSQDLLFDVAVHVGTLFSALVYFRSDIWAMACGALKCARGGRDQGTQLLGFVVLSSVPVIIAGFALHAWAPAFLRSVEVMAASTIIFGIVLWVADRFKPNMRAVESMSWREALFIGLAQVLALIPGTSRSGITMSAARWLGFSRVAAARYSLLLGIVAISGAGALLGLDLLAQNNLHLGLDVALAAFLAFISGWIAIALMMAWLARASFTIFAVYRVVLGCGLLGLIYLGVL